jgi:hypothetical protein
VLPVNVHEIFKSSHFKFIYLFFILVTLLNRWLAFGHLGLRVEIRSIKFMLLISGLAGLNFLGDLLGFVFFP